MVKNNKGFSMVELLAVVIIIGILIGVGSLAISKTLSNSKKNSFVSSLRFYIAGARNGIDSNAYNVAYVNKAIYSSFSTDINDSVTQEQAKKLYCKSPPNGYFTLIRVKDIKDEKNVKLSPWKSNWKEGYVAVVNVGDDFSDKFLYYAALVDVKKNGIDKFINENSIKRKDVKIGNANATSSSSQLGTLVSAYKTLNLDFNKDGNVVVTKSTTSRTIGDKTGLKLYMICR